MKILVLNTGSSSLKAELYQAENDKLQPGAGWQADANWKELPGQATVTVQVGTGEKVQQDVQVESLEHTAEELLKNLTAGDKGVLKSFSEIAAVGHRVVHGGSRYRQSMLLTDEVRQGIKDLVPYAPLHNPLALQMIEAVDKVMGKDTRQVVVFDTSFHATLPPESYLYPVPNDWAARGLRRYGFHGISHQYLSRRSTAMLKSARPSTKPEDLRIVSCHLGNGCSLCALKGGRSVETTMGFTPLEGLMMGTRSGTVDPGLVIYLAEQEKLSPAQIDHALNHDSGLKGLSGLSNDLRQVTAAAQKGDSNAQTAIAVFVYRLAYFISAMLPSLGGLDALVFAGGVGENASQIRSEVCRKLAFLGIDIDEAANSGGSDDRVISTNNSKIVMLVIHTREDYEIASECLDVLRLSEAPESSKDGVH